MPDRAPRARPTRLVSMILASSTLAFAVSGCSPGAGGASTAEKPKVNSRQLKHIEALQKGQPPAAR